MEDKALKNIKEMNVMGLFSIFALVLALLIAFTMSGFLDLDKLASASVCITISAVFFILYLRLRYSLRNLTVALLFIALVVLMVITCIVFYFALWVTIFSSFLPTASI